MQAKDVMTAPVLSVLPATPVELARKLLTSNGYASLPVVDEDDRLLGMVTEASLREERPTAERTPAGGPVEPRWACVGSVTETDILSIGPDTQVSTLAWLMLEHAAHTVPVVEKDGGLAGIVTRHDLVRLLARDDQIIACDVRDHLSVSGHLQWGVTVDGGIVELHCEHANEIERHIATIVAGSLPGVIGVYIVDPAV
jgi:CBS domain-containing protein